MDKKVYIFDPTAADEQSKVRGIGRYLKILQENLIGENYIYTNKEDSLPKDAIYVNPFFDPTKTKVKLFFKRTKHQIAVIHDLIPLKYPRYFPIGFWAKIKVFFNKWALKKYDLIVTDSQVSKNDIIRILGIPEKKIVVIYPTVTKLFLPHLTMPPTENSEMLFKHTSGARQAEPTYTQYQDAHLVTNEKIKKLTQYALYVGDATWNKNLVTLARSIKVANVPCVFVGKVFENTDPAKLSHPWQAELKAFLAEVKDDPLFIFPGYITDLELMYLYRHAKVNILISRDEGFGFSFIEAGIFSTPSVLSDTLIFREIGGKDNALMADPNNPNAIATQIVGLYFDHHQREVYSIKAFERAEDFKPEFFRAGWEKSLELVTRNV